MAAGFFKMDAQNFRKKIHDHVDRTIERSAVRVRNDVIRRMTDSPASGHEYKRGGVTHRASAPGEPPAVDRGKLRQAVVYQVRKGLHPGAVVGVRPGFEAQASALEYGSAAILPRPVWEPVWDTEGPRFRTELERGPK